MGKSNKPKKKYTPKPIRYPSLVTQINSFYPFEQALDRLLNTGEIETDAIGLYIFKDGAGINQSFVSTLKVYIEIIEIYAQRNHLTINTRPLHILQNRMFEARGFDEEEIIKARETLNVCKEIICKINSKELLDILGTVRISMKLEKNIEGSLKNPEVLLAKLKHRVGDLTYDEVLDKSKEYQELYEAHPEDEHIKKIRDIYLEYQAAYRFVKSNQLSQPSVS